MKILYGIQGTGNGHLTRSIEIIEHLREYATVDVLISGEQYDLNLPFEPEYRMKGLYFVFGKKGGIDFINTYKKINSFRFLKEVRKFPAWKYDLVISDFEPVTAWSSYINKVRCIGLSNQAATLHPDTPRPKSVDPLGKLILEYYAPVREQYGFHFKSIGDRIFTPIIRKKVRKLKTSTEGHYTVYLPSYDDHKIIKRLKRFSDYRFEVFSKHWNGPFNNEHISIHPIEEDAFLTSIASSNGVICNAGFGVTSEALYLGKKLIVIPMKNQYEQQCNASMLKSMGVQVVKSLKKKHDLKINEWFDSGTPVAVNYPDQTDQIVKKLLGLHESLLLRHA